MNPRMVGRWALVAGALLFAAFWATPALDVELPWLLGLAMHGATIGLLGFGLVGSGSRPNPEIQPGTSDFSAS